MCAIQADGRCDTVGEMDEILNSRWLHIAALRPPREERVFAPAWLKWNKRLWNKHKYGDDTPADRTKIRKHEKVCRQMSSTGDRTKR